MIIKQRFYYRAKVIISTTMDNGKYTTALTGYGDILSGHHLVGVSTSREHSLIYHEAARAMLVATVGAKLFPKVI